MKTQYNIFTLRFYCLTASSQDGLQLPKPLSCAILFTFTKRQKKAKQSTSDFSIATSAIIDRFHPSLTKKMKPHSSGADSDV